jgi:hypothetical protein
LIVKDFAGAVASVDHGAVIRSLGLTERRRKDKKKSESQASLIHILAFASEDFVESGKSLRQTVYFSS